jgi:hypothetical protein
MAALVTSPTLLAPAIATASTTTVTPTPAATIFGVGGGRIKDSMWQA